MSSPRRIANVARQAAPRWILAAVVGVAVHLLAAHAAAAGNLQVLSAAAHKGTKGLRVTVGSSCAGPQDLTVDGQTLSGPSTLEGCATISSSGTTVTSGQVTFRAGDHIALGDGFVVQSGATFVAQIDGVLLPDARVQDDAPAAQPHYSVGFFLNADALTLGASDRFDLFSAHAANGTPWFTMLLKRNAANTETRLVLEARQNDGSIVTTEGSTEVRVLPGWLWVSVDWRAAAAGDTNGYAEIYLGGTFYTHLTALSNSNGRVDTVRLGALGVDPGTSGSFDVDSFVSRIAGPISPPP